MVSRVATPRANSPYRISKVSVTGSTNADVLALARQGEPAGLVLAAAHQTAGRGRLDRRWDAPPGVNLLVSVLFRPAGHPSGWFRCATALAVAAVDACRDLGVPAGIKWPNDLVVVRDQILCKVGGILIEVQDVGSRRVILVGVGINLRNVPDDVPHATSIEEIAGKRISIEEALAASCERLKTAHEIFTSFGGFSRFKGRWDDVTCFSKNETEIAIEVGDRVTRGIYAGVDEGGSLLLSVDEAVQSFHSGHLVELKGLRS